MTRKCAPALLAVAFFAAASLTGCGHSSRGPDLSPVGRVSAPDAGLRTAGWGVSGGRLSILVRNDGTQLVRSARAVITARDRHGNAVATTSGSIRCCGIVQLAPGATSGLYAELGAAVRRVTAVTVRYAEVTLASPPRAAAPPPVTVADVALQTGGATTVVTARLTASGMPGTGESVRGQAVLTDAGGRVVAVLSQRVACLVPGRARAVRLVLPGPVPAGTVVSSVTTSPGGGGAC
jgi:hypothetical protein